MCGYKTIQFSLFLSGVLYTAENSRQNKARRSFSKSADKRPFKIEESFLLFHSPECAHNETAFTQGSLAKMASYAQGLKSLGIRTFSCQSVPIWSCQSNPWNPSVIFPTLAAPKPTSMSPFLGVKFCSSLSHHTPAEFSLEDHGVAVEVVQGLPHLTVPLPSRNEPCIFVLKPITHTIGDLAMMLKTEDHGIDRVVIRSTDGVRMASTTSIQTLMKSDFDLLINDVAYRVRPPPVEQSVGLTTLSDDELQRMGDVRGLVGQLYEVHILLRIHTRNLLPFCLRLYVMGQIDDFNHFSRH